MLTRRPLSTFGPALALVITLVTTFSTRADPRIIYVDADAPGRIQDGSSWRKAYRDVQPALSAATPGDEIWVAEGVYKPTLRTKLNDPRSKTFQLASSVAVYGGFAGTETGRQQRDWVNHQTILSGDIGAMGDINDNSYHVVTANNVDSTVLDGFTITGGNAPVSGGGMYIEFSSPTLNHVTFSDNHAKEGGGMYNLESSPILTEVTFSHNSAGEGGGMYNNYSIPTLTDVTFSGNTTTVYYGEISNGGGMYNFYSSPILFSVIFSDNSVSNGGGGMYNNYSSPILTDVTFIGNSADFGGGMINDYYSNPVLTNVTFSGNTAFFGGGMYNTYSSPNLTNVTFSNNFAKVNGGGMINIYSSPTLTDVTFSDNSVVFSGGGMINTYSSPILTDVTFSGNSANHGGGMVNDFMTPILVNVTFSGNSAIIGGGMNNYYSNPILTDVTFSGNSAEEGGGMYNENTSNAVLTNVIFSSNSATVAGGGMASYCGIPICQPSSPTLHNCILWGNTAPDGPQIFNDETSTAIITYSDVQGGYPGAGNIDTDPLFVDAPLGDLRLGLSSPAIDAGDNSAVPPDTLDLDGDGDTTEPLPYDLAGRPRFVDIDTIPDTGIGPPPVVDMGAYETAYTLYLSLVVRH